MILQKRIRPQSSVVYRPISTGPGIFQPRGRRPASRLVELNVQEQCLNIMKLSYVQQARAKGDYPRIHGWVYDIAQGTVVDLKINMANFKKELALYQLD